MSDLFVILETRVLCHDQLCWALFSAAAVAAVVVRRHNGQGR